MKPIKFRAWDKEQKEMFRVSSLELDVSLASLRGVNNDNIPTHIQPLKNIELMQYIGLKDKNGKEVYEGDIYWHPKIKNSMIVKWEELKDNFGIVGYGFKDGNFKETEVIGNIYENKVLIKELKDSEKM